MSATAPAGLKPRDAAESLADALADLGLTATVLATGGHQAHPCILIHSRPAAGGTPGIPGDQVYLAPADEGGWWFWNSDLDPIAPAGEVVVAADMIATALLLAASQAAGRARA